MVKPMKGFEVTPQDIFTCRNSNLWFLIFTLSVVLFRDLILKVGPGTPVS